jgi:hypothetical protein
MREGGAAAAEGGVGVVKNVIQEVEERTRNLQLAQEQGETGNQDGRSNFARHVMSRGCTTLPLSRNRNLDGAPLIRTGCFAGIRVFPGHSSSVAAPCEFWRRLHSTAAV